MSLNSHSGQDGDGTPTQTQRKSKSVGNESAKKAKKTTHEQFDEYLRSSGVMGGVTRAIVALYEEEKKPDDPLRYICECLGYGIPDPSEVESLQHEITTLRSTYEELQNENDKLQKLAEPKEEGPDDGLDPELSSLLKKEDAELERILKREACIIKHIEKQKKKSKKRASVIENEKKMALEAEKKIASELLDKKLTSDSEKKTSPEDKTVKKIGSIGTIDTIIKKLPSEAVKKITSASTIETIKKHDSTKNGTKKLGPDSKKAAAEAEKIRASEAISIVKDKESSDKHELHQEEIFSEKIQLSQNEIHENSDLFSVSSELLSSCSSSLDLLGLGKNENVEVNEPTLDSVSVTFPLEDLKKKQISRC